MTELANRGTKAHQSILFTLDRISGQTFPLSNNNRGVVS
jgi:hypothetical protein